jgi:hypothetical protein
VLNRVYCIINLINRLLYTSYDVTPQVNVYFIYCQTTLRASLVLFSLHRAANFSPLASEMYLDVIPSPSYSFQNLRNVYFLRLRWRLFCFLQFEIDLTREGRKSNTFLQLINFNICQFALRLFNEYFLIIYFMKPDLY